MQQGPPRNVEPHLRELQHGDITAALRLSAAVGWNQTAADWGLFLELGTGWGLFAAGEELIGTACVLPYGARIAWISMVIVRDTWRRRGLGRRLLMHSLGYLERRGRLPLLDATPAGCALYREMGFRELWGLRRLAGEAPLAWPTETVTGAIRPMEAEDLQRVGRLERAVFGVERTAVLARLRQQFPSAALVLEEGGGLRGYLLGREGRAAWQLGPLVAGDAAAARALLGAALAGMRGPVYVDVPDAQRALWESLTRAGWAPQRRFTRMIRGDRPAPGDPTRLYAIAGPELG